MHIDKLLRHANKERTHDPSSYEDRDTMKIEKVALETIVGRSRPTPAIYLNGYSGQPRELCFQDAERLAAVLGEETDNWIGKDVHTYPCHRDYEGDESTTVGAVSVRAFHPDYYRDPGAYAEPIGF
jgi:hypothetical protein